jgi:signal peptidase I
LAWIVTAALAVGAWLLVVPAAIGGPASYVVTQGISMLPHFHAGGLVITRKQSSYHVGEIVAYHNRQLEAVVMHRIVAVDGSRFVMKGDNNDWRDTYHPTKADIVGKEWVYWAGAGQYLTDIRQPVTFAIILAGLGLYAGAGLIPRRSRRRRRHAH